MGVCACVCARARTHACVRACVRVCVLFFLFLVIMDCFACLQLTSFGKDIQSEHVREDSGLEMDSPESRYALLIAILGVFDQGYVSHLSIQFVRGH